MDVNPGSSSQNSTARRLGRNVSRRYRALAERFPKSAAVASWLLSFAVTGAVIVLGFWALDGFIKIAKREQWGWFILGALLAVWEILTSLGWWVWFGIAVIVLLLRISAKASQIIEGQQAIHSAIERLGSDKTGYVEDEDDEFDDDI